MTEWEMIETFSPAQVMVRWLNRVGSEKRAVLVSKDGSFTCHAERDGVILDRTYSPASAPQVFEWLWNGRELDLSWETLVRDPIDTEIEAFIKVNNPASAEAQGE